MGTDFRPPLGFLRRLLGFPLNGDALQCNATWLDFSVKRGSETSSYSVGRRRQRRIGNTRMTRSYAWNRMPKQSGNSQFGEPHFRRHRGKRVP